MRRAAVLLAGLLALLHLLAAPARADDQELRTRVGDFEMVARQGDDRGHQLQREALERIADLGTPEAHAALDRLLVKHAGRDVVTDGLILAAWLRDAPPGDLDRGLQWVERQRRPGLLRRLGEAVSGIRRPDTREHLRDEALPRAPPPVKAQLARGLGLAGDEAAVPHLLRLVNEPNREVRVEATLALGAIADPRAVLPLLVFLRDEDAAVRAATASALGSLRDAKAVPPLIAALDDPAPRVVEAAATALSLLESPDAIGPLIERLAAVHETDLRVADTIAFALDRLTGKAFGTDPEPWRDWWVAVRDRPWHRPEAGQDANGGRTVAGAHYYGFAVRSSKVVFVLDVSRSMGWNGRLDLAKDELVRALESLPERTRFNVVVYSDEAEAWQEELRPAEPRWVRKAIAYVRRQKPRNGTNTHAALALALRDESVDTVFFLSDGHPSVGTVVDPTAILDEVRDWNRYRQVRIHAVALVRGQPPLEFLGTEDPTQSEAFMSALARENDGRVEVVR